jgi:hypothetical protein
MLLRRPERSCLWKRALTGWLAWTAASIIGGLFGQFWAYAVWWPVMVMLAIVTMIFPWPAGIPAGPWLASLSTSIALAIAGGLLGLGQAIALHNFLAHGRHITWIRPTVLAALVGGLVVGLGTFIFDMWSQPTPWVLAAGTVIGVIQWRGLREISKAAWIWIPANGLTLLAGARFVDPGAYPFENPSWMSLVAPVVIYSTTTGVVIVWLVLRDFDATRQPAVQSTAS